MARVLGVKLKSDKADARLIRLYGERFQPQPEAPPTGLEVGGSAEDHQRFQSLVARRRALVAYAAAESTRAREPSSGSAPDQIAQSIERMQAHLATEVDLLDGLIAAEISRSAALRTASERLQTAPGIGPVISAVLLALLPELGQLDRRAVAALAGLAPYDNQSGKWHGKKSIHGGRPDLARALYTAGLHASRGKGPLKPFRDALKARGKSTKQAIIACARRLLTMLNAMMKTKMDFRFGS